MTTGYCRELQYVVIRLDPRSIRLSVVKVVVGSEGTCNNCLFVEVCNYLLKFSNQIFDFLTSNS